MNTAIKYRAFSFVNMSLEGNVFLSKVQTEIYVLVGRGSEKAAPSLPLQRRAGVCQVQSSQQGREVHLPAQVAHPTLRGRTPPDRVKAILTRENEKVKI